jgi:hypothetical protein
MFNEFLANFRKHYPVSKPYSGSRLIWDAHPEANTRPLRALVNRQPLIPLHIDTYTPWHPNTTIHDLV